MAIIFLGISTSEILGNWSIKFSVKNPRNGIDIIYLFFLKKEKHLTGGKNNVPVDKCTFDGNFLLSGYSKITSRANT
jgi:hypothetical protein